MYSLKESIEVTVHLLLYILKQLGGNGDFHKIFKIMYFADQKHLAKYGSPISHDKYIAMQNGPVPSMAYDILKALRGEGLMAPLSGQFSPFFNLQNSFTIQALSEPDFESFSQSEIEVINSAIEENKKLGFKKLTDKSHDSAWKKAMKDFEIDIVDIAKAGGANSEMIKYINTHIENQLAVFE